MLHYLGNMDTPVINPLKTISWFKKLTAWIKKNWKIILAVVVTIAVFMLTQKGPSLRSVISRIREDYEKEIDVIDRVHDQEIVDREKAHKRYEDSVSEIEEKYAKNKKELDKKKRKEIKKIIADHGDNPEEITRRIAEVTGFNIHVS